MQLPIRLPDATEFEHSHWHENGPDHHIPTTTVGSYSRPGLAPRRLPSEQALLDATTRRFDSNASRHYLPTAVTVIFDVNHRHNGMIDISSQARGVRGTWDGAIRRRPAPKRKCAGAITRRGCHRRRIAFEPAGGLRPRGERC